ncbi:flavodoxin domain-containing protein [Besnoitia besnoiti]|uniref:Flavodoxin domain-containing protein n=1 Tax=Besnoitia besnoiti TaxID=94643 RepID=A0A2A9MQ58_BESBE|nr:flavodoxin domain-containing protein [Besnoitia besnoiti]PFH38090.1 flavodoxin domain-containing protein [Besnoitia besnoiti]
MGVRRGRRPSGAGSRPNEPCEAKATEVAPLPAPHEEEKPFPAAQSDKQPAEDGVGAEVAAAADASPCRTSQEEQDSRRVAAEGRRETGEALPAAASREDRDLRREAGRESLEAFGGREFLASVSPSDASLASSSPVPRLFVAFASQTGTAAEAARDLCRELLLLREARRDETAAALPPPTVASADDLVRLLPSLRALASPGGPGAAPREASANSESDAFVVFVVSTTGYGEMPENAQRLWRLLLRSSLPADALANLRFAVFGLGDRLYRQFNFAARKLHARLKQLGAKEFYRMGLGDDQHDFGYEGEFDPWLEGLLPAILALYTPSSSPPLSPSSPSSSFSSSLEGGDRLPPPLYTVRRLEERSEQREAEKEQRRGGFSFGTGAGGGEETTAREGRGVLEEDLSEVSAPLLAAIRDRGIEETRGGGASRAPTHAALLIGRILANTPLTPPSHFQKIFLLRLAVPRRALRSACTPDAAGSQARYGGEEAFFLAPGSVCSIFPLLPAGLAQAFLAALNLPGETRLAVAPNPLLTGQAVTREASRSAEAETSDEAEMRGGRRGVVVRAWDLFSQVCDVSGRPSRFLLRLLASWVANPLMKEKLRFLSSRSLEAKDEFCAYCRDERRTVAEVFWDFCCNASAEGAGTAAAGEAAPPLSDIVSAMPQLQSRKYSIANFVSPAPSQRQHAPGAQRGNPAQVANASLLLASPFLLQTRCPALLSMNSRSRARCIDVLLEAEDAQGEARGGGEGAADAEAVIEICYCVAEFETVSLRRCVGVCSSFLAQLQAGSLLSFEVEHSKLPPCFFDLHTPLILIAPGTGVAPVRALVQQRHAAFISEHRRLAAQDADRRPRREEKRATAQESLRPSSSALKRVSRDMLFLGFRREAADFLFAEDWSEFTSWLDVHVAFSRDAKYRRLGRDEATGAATSAARTIGDKKKIYVQDLLEEVGSQVAAMLIDEDAAVLISGRAHPMPSQVEEIFVEILEVHGGFSSDAARRFLADKKKRKRYVCDTWG